MIIIENLHRNKDKQCGLVLSEIPSGWSSAAPTQDKMAAE